MTTAMEDGEMAQSWYQMRDAIFEHGLDGRLPIVPSNPEDLEQAARAHLPADFWSFIARGAGSGRTLKANRQAFDRWEFVPRMLGSSGSADLTTRLLGTTMSAPVMLAPIGLAGLAHPRGEAAAARTVGDLGLCMVLSNSSSLSLEEVAEGAPEANLWFQLHPPRLKECGISMVERAEKAGYRAIVVTVDSGPAAGALPIWITLTIRSYAGMAWGRFWPIRSSADRCRVTFPLAARHGLATRRRNGGISSVTPA